MRAFERRLRLVSPTRPTTAPALGGGGERGDIALAAALLAVFLVPLASVLLHAGRWTPAELGVGAAGSICSGRALWDSARDALRRRRRS